jgi:Putative prokaryotic signal transducing protein
MTEVDWVEVVDAHNEPEAELIAGRLREAGIEPQLVASSHSPGAWLTGSRPQWIPVRIYVPADRADEARRLMDEFAGPEERDDEPQSSAPWTWGGVLTVLVVIVVVIVILANGAIPL